MPKWFAGQGSENEEEAGKAVEKKFETLETGIKEVKDNSVSKTEFQTVADGVKAINERFARDDEARRKTEETRRTREAAERNESYDPEKEFETLAGDPKGYVNSATSRAAAPGLLALGRQARADVLGNKPYYHGEFKAEVDRAIEGGTADYKMLSNPEYIVNCYRVVYAKWAEEDKLKDTQKHAAMHMMSDSGVSGGDKGNSEPTVQFRHSSEYSSDKAKFAAAQLGIKDEDIVKAAKEGNIKGLEVLA
ncbi:MAG TPA: hypothetical protein VGF75_08305 [Candidatus Saccharimonadales bacterium]|jgi:hypothetical protein